MWGYAGRRAKRYQKVRLLSQLALLAPQNGQLTRRPRFDQILRLPRRLCYMLLSNLSNCCLSSHTNLLGRKVEPMKCPGPLKNRKFLSPYFPSESVWRNATIHCTLRSRSNIKGFYLSVRQNNLIFFSSSSHSNVVSWFVSEQQQFEVLFKSWFQNLQYNIFFVSCRNSVCTQSF